MYKMRMERCAERLLAGSYKMEISVLRYCDLVNRNFHTKTDSHHPEKNLSNQDE
jgi:hypothetical protein